MSPRRSRRQCRSVRGAAIKIVNGKKRSLGLLVFYCNWYCSKTNYHWINGQTYRCSTDRYEILIVVFTENDWLGVQVRHEGRQWNIVARNTISCDWRFRYFEATSCWYRGEAQITAPSTLFGTTLERSVNKDGLLCVHGDGTGEYADWPAWACADMSLT